MSAERKLVFGRVQRKVMQMARQSASKPLENKTSYITILSFQAFFCRSKPIKIDTTYMRTWAIFQRRASELFADMNANAKQS